MIEKKGPWFENTIQTMADVDRMKVPDPYDNLAYTLDAIKITKRELKGRVPIIGFAGAPWTIFSYMIEGSGSRQRVLCQTKCLPYSTSGQKQ